jgi:hypothetical protein
MISFDPSLERKFHLCVKCGPDSADIHWRRDGMTCPRTGDGHNGGEHFDVQCRRCRYSWVEPVEAES